MSSATGAMRAVPRSPAVESFLRNFEPERARLPEVLELALCYGVCCLAHNFSLKGMSVAELRAVTEYDKVRKRDFFVRAAGISSSNSRPRRTPQSREPTQLQARPQSQQPSVRPKPSHSWRDGNADAEILQFPGASAAEYQGSRGDAHAPAPASAEMESGLLDQRTAVDDVDFFAALLGKQFVDAAWAAFADRRGALIPTQQALAERFTRLDQRKAAGSFPACALPVASFPEFLREYVKSCVAQHPSVRSSDAAADERVAGDSVRAAASSCGDVVFGVPDAVAAARARRDRPPAVRAAPTRVASAPAAAPRPPKALAHVQSRIKPELDARREKLLRVKKTQTQLMKESLARTRLAEYEAKRMIDAAGNRRGGDATRKMPLADITTGAAALEIADGFMTSPLLDSFGDKENEHENSRAAARARPDPLREELYGAAALDDSYLGCKPPPPSAPAGGAPAARAAGATKKASRAYNGWLGDFGPQHTKTVVTEWGDVDDDADDSDVASEREPRSTREGARRSSTAKRFEWKLGGGATSPHRRRTSSKSEASRDDFSASEGDGGDAFSDGTDDSDPVFTWLKRAV